ncbi:MAG: alpha/beta fold hydrolase [Leucobacter sp.]
MNESLKPAVYSAVAGKPDAAATHRVVFLHGLFGRGRNFNTIAGALAPEVQSLLVDLPNHGKSAWTADFDYDEMADLVATHLREGFAAGGPVDVVGHSMGGKVAMVLALRHPDIVRRLVVVDIAPVVSDPAQGNFSHLLSSLANVDLARVKRRSDADEMLQEPIPQIGVRGFLMQNLKHGDSGFFWEPNLTMLHAELATIMGFPDMKGTQFTGPVLWIRGSKSDYVADAAMPTMRELFPDVELFTIQGSGHWVHSEKPAEFTAALRGFLL